MVTVSDQKGDTKTQWKLQTPAEVEGNITQLQVLHPSEVYFKFRGKKKYTNNVYKLIINITWINNITEVWSLSPRVSLSAVGLEFSSVGRLQQQWCGDSIRACDVFSLQPADGSSAAHTNTPQPGQLQHQHTHHLPHRHTHQSSASHQGNTFTQKLLTQSPFLVFPYSNYHLILQT